MFEERSLLKISDFQFKDGKGSKTKYFLVLRNIGEDTIVATLPTSQNVVPFGIINGGCIDMPELNFRCFCFLKEMAVTDTDFCFPLTTYIYGRGVEDYNIETLSLNYKVENEDYTKCGILNESIYLELLHCLKDASNIKRKFKKMIVEWISQIQ